jgi:hypothetical protein
MLSFILRSLKLIIKRVLQYKYLANLSFDWSYSSTTYLFSWNELLIQVVSLATKKSKNQVKKIAFIRVARKIIFIE